MRFAIVTCTVSAVESLRPSLTTREKTSVPDVAGAVNVGFDVVPLLSETAGPEVCVHRYESALPSTSLLAEPSSVTVAALLTDWSAPALDTGARFGVSSLPPPSPPPPPQATSIVVN